MDGKQENYLLARLKALLDNRGKWVDHRLNPGTTSPAKIVKLKDRSPSFPDLFMGFVYAGVIIDKVPILYDLEKLDMIEAHLNAIAGQLKTELEDEKDSQPVLEFLLKILDQAAELENPKTVGNYFDLVCYLAKKLIPERYMHLKIGAQQHSLMYCFCCLGIGVIRRDNLCEYVAQLLDSKPHADLSDCAILLVQKMATPYWSVHSSGTAERNRIKLELDYDCLNVMQQIIVRGKFNLAGLVEECVTIKQKYQLLRCAVIIPGVESSTLKEIVTKIKGDENFGQAILPELIGRPDLDADELLASLENGFRPEPKPVAHKGSVN